MSAALDSRAILLQETAILVGQRWFAAWRDDLRGEGRGIVGGWPGTMPEARALVAASIAPALASRHMSAVTNDELARAMRATYDEARRAWLTSSERRRESDL